MGKERYFHVKTTTSDGVVHDSKKEATVGVSLNYLRERGR